MLVPQADLMRWLDYEPPERLIDMDEFAERFWAKVDRSGEHWLWTDKPNDNGYGRMAVVPGVVIGAHRIAWVLQHGSIPSGLWVLHECDIPLCVRHLFLGTSQDNVADMVAKGRNIVPRNVPRGDRHMNAKVTPEIEAEVGRMSRAGMPQIYIAEVVGISQSHVSKIVRGCHRTKAKLN